MGRLYREHSVRDRLFCLSFVRVWMEVQEAWADEEIWIFEADRRGYEYSTKRILPAEPASQTFVIE